MRGLAKVLTVADIVRERKAHGMTRGTSEWAVRRWLHKLDRQTRGKVLVSRCPLLTTRAALMRADPRWLEERALDRDQLAALLERVRGLELRVGAQGARLRELSRLADALSRAALKGRGSPRGAPESAP